MLFEPRDADRAFALASTFEGLSAKYVQTAGGEAGLRVMGEPSELDRYLAALIRHVVRDAVATSQRPGGLKFPMAGTGGTQ